MTSTTAPNQMWGWLRVLLGVVQLAGAGLGVGLLAAHGWTRAVWWAFAVTLLAMALGRLLYRGRSGPTDERKIV